MVPGARVNDDFPHGSQVLNAEQQHLLELLGDGRHCVESLAVAMDSDLRNVQRLLTSLELAGVLRRHRDRYCKR
jgi:predicted transcriptional regulator